MILAAGLFGGYRRYMRRWPICFRHRIQLLGTSVACLLHVQMFMQQPSGSLEVSSPVSLKLSIRSGGQVALHTIVLYVQYWIVVVHSARPWATDVNWVEGVVGY